MTKNLSEEERVRKLKELTEREAINPEFEGFTFGDVLRSLVKPIKQSANDKTETED